METLIHNIFISNWQQKAVALLTAVVVWFFVSHSIMETKVIPSIPIRIVNIPPDYTILGLMPNGILNKRITLTVTGTKDVVEDLEPGDLEIVVDASMIDHSDWVLRITKNNLVSLTTVDLKKHISTVNYSEYVIKIRPLVTAEIPITMLPPRGDPPPGYELLDVWPINLVQNYSGAEEEIDKIKTNGLELQFDLNRITKADLDSIAASDGNEVTFFVPSNWKQVCIPCRIHCLEEINDPDADDLQINFLLQDVFPLSTEIPIRVFYPVDTYEKINPESYPLVVNDQIKLKKGIKVFTPKLFVHDVTREFLNVIQDHLEIVISASTKPGPLQWSVEIINPQELEEKYVKTLLELHPRGSQEQKTELYRKRFREYMRKFELYSTPDEPLKLEAYLGEGKIDASTPD